MDVPKAHHFNTLDCFRGIAALLVVIFHLELFPAGYLCVDFFFILSGFILSHCYIFRDPKISNKDFFLKRLIRLYPMYLFSLLIYVIFIGFLFSHEAFTSQNIAILILQLTLTLNLGIETHKLYWNYPDWSVCVEIWAGLFLFFFFSKTTKWWVFPSISLLCVFIIGQNYNNLKPTHEIIYSFLNCGMIRGILSFSLGCLTYKIFRKIENTQQNHSKTLINIYQISTLIMVATIFYLSAMSVAYIDFLALPVFCLLILAFANDHSFLAQKIKKTQFLGKISYSIYLNQAVIIMAAQSLLRDKNIPDTFLAILVMTLLILYSHLTFKYIEAPSKRYFEKLFHLKRTEV